MIIVLDGGEFIANRNNPGIPANNQGRPHRRLLASQLEISCIVAFGLFMFNAFYICFSFYIVSYAIPIPDEVVFIALIML